MSCSESARPAQAATCSPRISRLAQLASVRLPIGRVNITPTANGKRQVGFITHAYAT